MASYSRGSALCQQLCNLASNPNFQKIAKTGKKKNIKKRRVVRKAKKLQSPKKKTVKRKASKKKTSK